MPAGAASSPAVPKQSVPDFRKAWNCRGHGRGGRAPQPAPEQWVPDAPKRYSTEAAIVGAGAKQFLNDGSPICLKLDIATAAIAEDGAPQAVRHGTPTSLKNGVAKAKAVTKEAPQVP